MHLLLIFAACLMPAPSDVGFTGFSAPDLSNNKSIRMLTPETADFMKASETVTFFHMDSAKNWDKPGRRSGDQLLTGAARTRVVAILADPANYYQGLYTIGDEPRFGIEFKTKGEAMTVICGCSLVDGRFRGRRLTGALSEVGGKRLEDWFRNSAAKGNPPNR